MKQGKEVEGTETWLLPQLKGQSLESALGQRVDFPALALT